MCFGNFFDAKRQKDKRNKPKLLGFQDMYLVQPFLAMQSSTEPKKKVFKKVSVFFSLITATGYKASNQSRDNVIVPCLSVRKGAASFEG